MSAQAPPVEITWEGGFPASTEAFLAWLGWRGWIVRVGGLLVAIWVVGTAGGAGPMIVGLIEGLVLVSAPEWIAAIGWWMSRRLGRRFVSLIDATGIARRTEVTSWFYSWESFSQARRTRRYWILRAGRALVVLPLSKFSPEDEERFRTYLAAAGLLR